MTDNCTWDLQHTEFIDCLVFVIVEFRTLLDVLVQVQIHFCDRKSHAWVVQNIPKGRIECISELLQEFTAT